MGLTNTAFMDGPAAEYKGSLLGHEGKQDLGIAKWAKRMHQRKSLTCAAAIVMALLFFLGRTYTRIPEQVEYRKGAHGRQASCLRALESQRDMLVQQYAKSFAGVTHIALIQAPGHPNKGDAAIWIGEDMILQELKIETIYTCKDHDDCNKGDLRRILEAYGGTNTTALVFHGGGNYIWDDMQRHRESFVKAFPDFKIRSFPQTYQMSGSESLKQAQEVYGAHTDLELVARDKESFEAMHKDFSPANNVLLLPDAATMLLNHPLTARPPRKTDVDFLWFARDDNEGGQNHQNTPLLQGLAALPNQSGDVTETNIAKTDWVQVEPDDMDHFSLHQKALLRVRWAFDFVGQGALIMTDRLHGHILSTVWGFDHITFEDGKYRKLMRYHNTWLSACTDHTVTASSLEEAFTAAKTWYRNGRTFAQN